MILINQLLEEQNQKSTSEQIAAVPTVDLTENLEAEIDFGDAERAVDQLHAIANGLDEQVDFVAATKEDGGLDKFSVVSVDMGVNQLVGEYGMGGGLPSLENFGDATGRMEGTALTMESIKKKALAVYRAIRNALKKLWVSMKKWWNSFMDSVPKQIAKLEAVIEEAGEKAGKPKETKLKLDGSTASQTQYGGKVSKADIISGLAAAKVVADGLFSQVKVVGETIAEGASNVSDAITLEKGKVKEALIEKVRAIDPALLSTISAKLGAKDIDKDDKRIVTKDLKGKVVAVRAPEMIGGNAVFASAKKLEGGVKTAAIGGDLDKIGTLLSEASDIRFKILPFEHKEKELKITELDALNGADVIAIAKAAVDVLKSIKGSAKLQADVEKAGLETTKVTDKLNDSAADADIEEGEKKVVTSYCTGAARGVTALASTPVKLASTLSKSINGVIKLAAQHTKNLNEK